MVRGWASELALDLHFPDSQEHAACLAFACTLKGFDPLSAFLAITNSFFILLLFKKIVKYIIHRYKPYVRLKE